MFAIIWSRWGFVVPIIAIVGFVLGLLVYGAIFDYLADSNWAWVLASLFAAVGTYALPGLLGNLVDHATGESVKIGPRDTFFFIPVRAWTWIFLALATCFAGAALLKS